jgi:hypothetical protein
MNRNTSLYTLLIACLMCLTASLQAQEFQFPLRFNAQANQQFLRAQRLDQYNQRGGGASLSLPFFDDFSRYSLATNDPLIPVAWQRWSDNAAYINCTFPINPMTIGVATLDGLESDGTPYSDTLYFPTISESFLDWGLADTLTSLPLNLAGHTADDSLYLLFHVQAGGIGNAPDADGILGAEGDTLVLEFYTPLQNGQWNRVWAKEGGIDPSVFDTVFISITDPIYMQDGFRFRFKNYCTLHGALDHWHLDYVLLRENISPANFFYNEVAFQYCNNSLLNFGLTAMPWTHYQASPEFYMRDSITYYQRNLGITASISSQCKINYEGTQQFVSNTDANTQSNGYSAFDRSLSLNGYEFNAPGALDSASFEVSMVMSPTDDQTQNDTMSFVQQFTNYYAYDDGTAERAYGLQNAGGKVALRYTTPVDDTLLGAYIYFEPIQYLATDQSFILQAWDDITGAPGNLLTSEFDNYSFSLPHYYESGPNLFVYYSFTNPVAVSSGNFYIGTLQQSDVSLNFGLDKNTNANATKLFYQLQGSSDWQQSNITGSAMIRPVFKSGLPQWVGVEDHETAAAVVYPNPVNDELHIQLSQAWSNASYFITDSQGRTVLQGKAQQQQQINLPAHDLAPGAYSLALRGNNNTSSITRFIKQ